MESRPLTDRIRRITLRPLTDHDSARADHRRAPAGSHLDVRVELADRRDTRSYSIVESSDDGRDLSLSVMLSPSTRGGSGWMHGLQVGDTVECTQPLQNFELRLGAARRVLLAGGIGITALYRMAQVLQRTGGDYTLVYVGRSRAAMAYLDELQDLHGDRLRVHVDAEGTGLDVAGLVAELAAGGDPGGVELYMCGPIRLMDAVRREWAGADLPVHNLRFETFGNSGWFEPEAFVVRVPSQDLETTVGADSTILEALSNAGAEMMFDCRKGECGLCQVDVCSVEGDIDHRDVFFSAAQQQANTKVCTCVSRVAGGGAKPAVLTLELP